MPINNITISQDPRRASLDGTILVAHQPQFLPWLGFFNKAAMGDVYLIHDIDQFKKETFENRNKVRIHNQPGWTWITAPVSGKSEILNISDVKFVSGKWRRKALKTIVLSYKKAPFFDDYFEQVKEILNYPNDNLREFNINAIKQFFNVFGIDIPVYRSSELIKEGYKLEGKSTEAVISMCKWFDADNFVAGVMGKEYLDKEKFKDEDIQLVFQKFSHPVYEQIHEGFMPYMSVIDLIFNHGPGSKEILGRSNIEY